MLDASALLWRLYLEGEDTGARFGALADAWVSRTVDEPWYVFNDMHAVMALGGRRSPRPRPARVVDRLERYAAPVAPRARATSR